MISELSIVISTYQSADHITETLQALASYLRANPELSYELILVDDGSKDATTSLISRNISAFTNVKAFHLNENYGQLAAMAFGLFKSNGSKILTMDDDLKYDLNTMNEMISAANPIVYGKAMNGDRWHRNLYRKLFTFFSGNIRSSSYRCFDSALLPADRLITEPFEVYCMKARGTDAPYAELYFPIQKHSPSRYHLLRLIIAGLASMHGFPSSRQSLLLTFFVMMAFIFFMIHAYAWAFLFLFLVPGFPLLTAFFYRSYYCHDPRLIGFSEIHRS